MTFLGFPAGLDVGDPHRFTSKMRAGLSAIMNYVGGAIIYIRYLTASSRDVKKHIGGVA